MKKLMMFLAAVTIAGAGLVTGCASQTAATSPTINLANVVSNTTNALEQAAAAYQMLKPYAETLKPIVEQYLAAKQNCKTCQTDTAAAACAAGCADAKSGRVAPAARTAAVICGLTRVDPGKYGGWSGACPGCDVDAQAFAIACQASGVPYEILLNGQATYLGIVASAKRAAAGLQAGDLLILYISGHGGQVADPGDASEADGKSETLCLYDGPLTDNAVWEWYRQLRVKGIRIWMISDTCNSGTNYRSPHDYAAGVKAKSAGEDPQMLHWGGCADGHSSFGSAQGGTFTTALVDSYKAGQSYAEWFDALKRRMPFTQRPTCEFTGADFQSLPAFR